MTSLRSARAVVCAGALVIAAGCSKSNEPDETAAPEPAITEGSEAQDVTGRTVTSEPSGMDTSSAGIPSSETERMDESGRESSAAKSADDKAPGGALRGDEMKTMPGETGAAQNEAAATMSDSEIAYLTKVVNNGEIEQAQIAVNKADNPQVKRFAQHMIVEHRKANQAGAKVVKQAKLIPEESGVATKIEDEGTGVIESLRSTERGEGFDRLYMEAQVQQHQKVLDMLDNELIPSADNPQLKTELQSARAMVERHLTQAQEIHRALMD